MHWKGKDRDGSILGVVYMKHKKGLVELNLTLVKNGCAWNSSHYDKISVYAEAEKDARKNRRGLWRADSPVNPRQWRDGRR